MNTELKAAPRIDRTGSLTRQIVACRVRLLDALLASGAASITFLALYYLTLGLLPSTFVGLSDYHPLALWNDRLDLAQFVGVIFNPPYPTRLTWWIGIGALLSVLMGAGATFALIDSWTLSKPSPLQGLFYGGALFVVIGSAVSLGSGYNPAVMRQALPDVGFFFLGWTGWAALQLLACSLAFGWVWGSAYRLSGTSEAGAAVRQ